jgi:GDPmannose 4,6-dehydratase
MSRCAVIGCSGQDGKILSNLLRARGDTVIAIKRGDLCLTDAVAVGSFLKKERPDFIYYLAAYHHSSEDREYVCDAEMFRLSFDTHVHGVIAFLDELVKLFPKARFFYASSSHVFGSPESAPQTEETPFRPHNIYAISKSAGVHVCQFYRKKYGVHVSTGILYNHESVLRDKKFVSQKIIHGALAVSRGEISSIRLGDLNACVDWGYAPDYVDAMVRITSLEVSDDYIIATGVSHTVREFAEIAFSKLGLNWENHVTVDPGIVRPSTPVPSIGNYAKLKQRTGWIPQTSFDQMIELMLQFAAHDR